MKGMKVLIISSSVLQKQSSGTGYDSLTFDTNILSSTANKYAVSGTANLTIYNVASSDEGLYQCAIGSTIREISFTPVGKHHCYDSLKSISRF